MNSDDKFGLIMAAIIISGIVLIVALCCWCSVTRARIFSEGGYIETTIPGHTASVWSKP